jgi:small subunit ribosomal protein S6e
MRRDVHGGVRRQVILSGGIGFNPKNEGERRRKTVRGNIITDEVVQLNMKIVEKPKQPKETKKTKEKRKKEKPEKETEAEAQTTISSN